MADVTQVTTTYFIPDFQQDRQCTHTVTLRRVHETAVAMKKQ